MTATNLPLSAFEHLMIAQDSPAYPCVLFVRFHFHGVLDKDLFESSLREMLDRHPLLRSRVQRHWRGLRWLEGTSDRVPVQWLSTEPSDEWVADSRLDLFCGPGVKVFVHTLSDTSTVIFQIHHACVDGKGAANAFDDLWRIYDARTRGTEPALPVYDPKLLVKRNHFGLTFRLAMDVIPKQWVGLLGVRQYLMREPVPIVPHEAIAHDREILLPVRCHTTQITESEIQKLRQVAMQNGVTLNELLIASIFEGIAGFRKKRGLRNENEWIRMMVPVNMRATDQDARQTACNIVSSVFLDRTPTQIEDREGLMAGIHEEMEVIKRNRLGFMFIASIWVKKRFPSTRISNSTPGRCQTTVVVTNVGKLFHHSPLLSSEGTLCTGNLVLVGIKLLAPMTPYLSATFTISEYARDVFIGMRYDPRIIMSQAASELLDLVAQSVRSRIPHSPAVIEA
jgi:NRPS condensation-like uncharacterized protein